MLDFRREEESLLSPVEEGWVCIACAALFALPWAFALLLIYVLCLPKPVCLAYHMARIKYMFTSHYSIPTFGAIGGVLISVGILVFGLWRRVLRKSLSDGSARSWREEESVGAANDISLGADNRKNNW
jgi:hypothetical protein